jgi:hypothetical protein
MCSHAPSLAYRKNHVQQAGQWSYTKLGGANIWLNPPYSKPLIWQFVEKLAEHGNGIALLFNRCDSNKFQDIIFTKATGMMFLRNRIKFFRPDGTRGDSPGCGSVLIAFGRENAEILRNCSLQGKYVELNNDK